MKVSLTKKMFVLVVLTLLMWVPLLMIEHTVSERTLRRDVVEREIADSLAGDQQLFGPLLVVPYRYSQWETVKVGEGPTARHDQRWVQYESSLQIIPTHLSVHTELIPSVLSRGIFKAITYQAQTVLEGEFNMPANLPENAQQAIWQSAEISIGIDDIKGLSSIPVIEWNETNLQVEPGVSSPLFNRGVKASVGKLDTTSNVPLRFKINLSLRGTKRFYVAPIAKEFTFDLKSAWPHPSFIGHYLPSEREVSAQGFSAKWQLTDFATHAREAEQCFSGSERCGLLVSEDTFGVALIDPVDNYLQAERAVKYGFLFVVLTFSAVFLTETLRKQAVHPIQYLLIGIALALFFLLLLAFSEQVEFIVAYLIAAIACVSLIAFYLSHALSNRVVGVSSAVLLTLLYAVMYQLLQSEDSALLLGSSLLFILLAIAMIVTRHVNWFELTEKVQSVSVMAEAK